mgnify:FL=1
MSERRCDSSDLLVDAVGRDLGPWSTLLLLPIFILVPLNLYGQYYLVTHVPPGFPSSRALALSPNPLPQDIERRWFDLNTEKSLWSPERWGMRKRGRPLTSGYGHVSQQDGNEGQNGSKRIRRCRKCDGPKPEVSRRVVAALMEARASLQCLQTLHSAHGPPLPL